MGFLGLGGGKKAAREQAKATLTAAKMQADSDSWATKAMQTSQETMIAQSRASSAAAELLSTPQEKVDVQLSTDPNPAEIDETTGRRKTTRTPFTAPRSSGVSI